MKEYFNLFQLFGGFYKWEGHWIKKYWNKKIHFNVLQNYESYAVCVCVCVCGVCAVCVMWHPHATPVRSICTYQDVWASVWSMNSGGFFSIRGSGGGGGYTPSPPPPPSPSSVSLWEFYPNKKMFHEDVFCPSVFLSIGTFSLFLCDETDFLSFCQKITGFLSNTRNFQTPKITWYEKKISLFFLLWNFSCRTCSQVVETQESLWLHSFVFVSISLILFVINIWCWRFTDVSF